MATTTTHQHTERCITLRVVAELRDRKVEAARLKFERLSANLHPNHVAISDASLAGDYTRARRLHATPAKVRIAEAEYNLERAIAGTARGQLIECHAKECPR